MPLTLRSGRHIEARRAQYMDLPGVAQYAQNRLPLEITDMITDFLFDDTRALAAMSLACKAFLPSTRLHLFESLTLRLDYPFHWGNVQARLEELTTASLSLAPFVRRLNIFAPDTYLVDEVLNLWLKASFPLFAILRGITSLSVRISWVEIQPETRKGVFACFSGLLELSLENGFCDAIDIIGTLLRFPTLERLCLDNIYWITDFNAVFGPIDVLPLPCLRSLSIHGASSNNLEPMLGWFRSIDVVPPLHTFRVGDIILNNCATVGLFVRALGPALRHLKLGFNCSAGGVFNMSFFCIYLSFQCSIYRGTLFAWPQH
jgi:hypothetical protein